LLLFLFRVIRPGGTLSCREQRWLLIGYAIRFAVVLFTPLVAALFDVVLPELNSVAYAVFAVFIYIGISRSFFLSLTPQRSIGSILGTMEEFLFLTTPRLTVVFANDAAQRLLGAGAGTLHGKLLPELFGLSERRTVPEELRYLDTQGEWRDLQILSTEVSSTSGGATGYVFLGRDVSEDRRREAALRETVLIKESVLRELHHRLYNTLQTVTSLLHLKAGTAATSETTEALSQSASRVDRMAQVYRLAHAADDFTAVSFDDLLDRVTMDAYQAYPESREIKFSVTADPAALDVSLAVPLLLIAGELVENAVRHAFPASPSKSIRVEYRYQGPREWQLTVSDNGVGLPETTDREKGGLLMVEALAEQAGACMRIDSTGGTMVAICTHPPSAPSQNR